MRRLVLALMALAAAACVPEGGSMGRTGAPPPMDGGASGPPGDGGGAAEDSGVAPDSGVVRAYCGDQSCDANESCQTCVPDCGPCMCPEGFVLFDGRCAPDAPEPWVRRLEDDVCQKWRADFVRVDGEEWAGTFGSMDMCDPGVVSEASRANALRRTNLYRWLAGLGRVEEDPTLRDQQQACAVVLHGLGGLDHRPADSTPCWTQGGYDGASSSNLAYAGGGLAVSVDLYVGDRGVPSLGHRRWVLNPSMVQTTFGYKPPFSCMYAFSRGTNTEVDVQAYPPPGYVPAQAGEGEWSFRMDSIDFVDPATIVEVDIDGAGWTPVDIRVVGGSYGAGPVLAWALPRATWSAGTVVRVRLSNPAGQQFTYTVAFADCG